MTRLSKDLTREELFAELCRISEAGGFPSRNGNSCAYRGDDGRMCAVGLFIPDDLAAKGDRFGIGMGNTAFYTECRPFLPDWMTREEAQEMQLAHDVSANGGKWDALKFRVRLAQALKVSPEHHDQ